MPSFFWKRYLTMRVVLQSAPESSMKSLVEESLVDVDVDGDGGGG
jgi:hypothetical protein